MPRYSQILLSAALLLASSPGVRAQTAPDPSGHWEGSIHWEGSAQVPAAELSMEVDLAKNGRGQLTGEISIPAHKLLGRPLVNIAAQGESVTFQIALSAPGDNMFKAVLAEGGKSMSGDLIYQGMPLPFTLTRTGDSRMKPPARSTPIGKEVEGTWNGTLAVGDKSLRLVLTLKNQPDGTAAGKMVNLDQGNMEIPITTITQKATSLTLDFKAVGGSYTSATNAEGTELVGTWTQGPVVLPLAFRRAPE